MADPGSLDHRDQRLRSAGQREHGLKEGGLDHPRDIRCSEIAFGSQRGVGVPGKFVIKKGSTGKFRFSLVSTNGQIVATSEAYNSKASAKNGIRSVQKLAADAAIEDQTTK